MDDGYGRDPVGHRRGKPPIAVLEVKLSGRRTVSGLFSGKLCDSTEGAILMQKNLSGKYTEKCIGIRWACAFSVFYWDRSQYMAYAYGFQYLI
jgi:hypothetical protein